MLLLFFSAGALKTTAERPSYLNTQIDKAQQQKKSAPSPKNASQTQKNSSQTKKNKPGSAGKKSENKKTQGKEEEKKTEMKAKDSKEVDKERSDDVEKLTEIDITESENFTDSTQNQLEEITDAVESVTLEKTRTESSKSARKKARKAEQQKKYEEQQKQKQKPEKPPKAPKSKKPKSALEQASEDDFDALIAAAQKENTFCHFSGCKQRTSVLGQTCEFCSQRFCLTHHIPEVHGCGTRAKENARRVICREGVLYRGSGVPDKKPDPAKRNYLERKLEKKMGELEASRKPKKKEKS